jgi:putative endonuclease
MSTVTVYALRFEGGELYVGLTDDLARRVQEHRRRQSPSTRRFVGEFELIYQKPFPGYAQARSHEKFLKSGAGRKLLAERQGVKRPERRGTSQALPGLVPFHGMNVEGSPRGTW